MSNAIIVGNGPSILMENMGEDIDHHDYVIRLKNCREQQAHPETYGNKTDIVGGSLTIAGTIREIEAPMHWIWVDSRHAGVDVYSILALQRSFPGPVVLDKGLCSMWDAQYMGLREIWPLPEMHEQMEKSRYADERGEKHLSQGFKAILYALNYLPIDELILVGFDNLLTGEFTWSTTRGPEWDKYPFHRWDIEHHMLNELREHSPVKIGFLLPELEETHATD